MKTSKAGLQLIKSHESLRLLAYDDFQPHITITHESQIKGTLTIGYGHTKNVKVGQRITENMAEILLTADLVESEKVVNQAAKEAFIDLAQNEFDALVSWIFNTGNGKNPIQGRSAWKALVKMKNAEKELKTFYMKYYITSKSKVMTGLIRRRSEELQLLLSK